MKKIFCMLQASVICLTLFSLSSCSNKSTFNNSDLPTIDELTLGAHTDVSANIKVLTFRTDIMDKLNGYTEQFHHMYPNINVTYEGVDDYEANTIMSYRGSL